MTRRQYRFDAATRAVRRPASRRLAVETLESRVLLSGTQLDYIIWNLDSIQTELCSYLAGRHVARGRIVRFDHDELPRSGVTTLNVGWVIVPGFTNEPRQRRHARPVSTLRRRYRPGHVYGGRDRSALHTMEKQLRQHVRTRFRTRLRRWNPEFTFDDLCRQPDRFVDRRLI